MESRLHTPGRRQDGLSGPVLFTGNVSKQTDKKGNLMRKAIQDFRAMVEKGEKIVYLTAYDYLTAKMQERAGVDMILVGDSLGMVSLGYDTTFPVTMNDMIRHCQAVRRGAPNVLMLYDIVIAHGASFQPSKSKRTYLISTCSSSIFFKTTPFMIPHDLF